jgi:hypothetical protein
VHMMIVDMCVLMATRTASSMAMNVAMVVPMVFVLMVVSAVATPLLILAVVVAADTLSQTSMDMSMPVLTSVVMLVRLFLVLSLRCFLFRHLVAPFSSRMLDMLVGLIEQPYHMLIVQTVKDLLAIAAVAHNMQMAQHP